MKIGHFGTLYVVATPIGNLRDMSLRAVEVLKTVDRIAAEDTRHSLPLLQHFAINTPMVALHEHNEREYSLKLLEWLRQGESVALISDAGTPLISDPGLFLIREARKAGVTVVPIPGPCAVITALSVSGLSTNRFTFEGFLSARSSQRIKQLQALSHEQRTMIFYETPHRLLECLHDMQQVFGAEREVVIARELTKIYETILSGFFSELIERVTQDANQQRGEIVLLVAGKNRSVEEDDDISTDATLTILLDELPLKQAVELAARISGKRKNELYQRALQIKK